LIFDSTIDRVLTFGEANMLMSFTIIGLIFKGVTDDLF